MSRLRRHFVLIFNVAAALGAASAPAADVRIADDGVLVIDGKPTFPISLTLPPPPGSVTPTGKSAFAEFHEAGITLIRTGPMGGNGRWDDAWIAKEQAYLDEAAAHGLLCAPWLRELATLKPGQDTKKAKLHAVIDRFKKHPGLGVWKGADEPEWGKTPVDDCLAVYDVIHEQDPKHPVWIVQAPRGTVESLKPYAKVYDIGGTDIYPISYPPGAHSLEANKDISMVGDYAVKTRQFSDGKPFWMTLQIAWSGVSGKGKTLRMPTFPQLRYMTYQSIINGARGVVFFGGHVPQAWDERDAKLGWNWRFWDRVLRPVIDEIGPNGPLAEALVAPPSDIELSVEPADAAEVAVRETPSAVYVLAARRAGDTIKLNITGLPAALGDAAVLFEEPRRVHADAGKLEDWFAPYDVHVYRFDKGK